MPAAQTPNHEEPMPDIAHSTRGGTSDVDRIGIGR
jgi:hypothetical protein